MSLRRWIAVLTLLGVLAHAAALVRHNASVLGMALAQIGGGVGVEFAKDLAVICSARDAAGAAIAANGSKPVPADKQECPICMGLASVFALPAVDLPATQLPQPAFIAEIAGQDQRVTVQRRLRPPGRAPPTVA